MASYEITIPGAGTYRVEAKGELTEQQAYQAAVAQSQADPTVGMSGTERFMAGAGKAVADIGRGAGQMLGIVNDQDVAESRSRDAALMATGAGRAGNIAGGVAAVVPTMFIPGVNTYAGAAAVGGISGALLPTVGNESRIANAALGAGLGMGGQAAGNAIGRALKPVQTTPSPKQAALVQAAQANDIPLTAGDITGSRPLKIVESVMENLPLTSGPQLAVRNTQAKAFNKAVLEKAGIVGDEATPAVINQRFQDLGSQFQQIAGRNAIDFNQGPIMSDLAKIASDGGRRLSNPEPLKNTIDDILADAANGVMEGTKYQGWRETLGRLSKGSGTEAHYFSQVKKTLDKAFSSQVSTADSAAWKQASREYGNLKTIANAMGGAGAGTKAGNIAPSQLESALTGSVGREGKARGRGDLNELVGIGRTFVSDNIPNSGTAQRQLVQSVLTGSGGAGLGAVGAAATGNDPLQGAMYGLGATGIGLLAPRAVQAAMNSPAGQAYLSRGLLTLSPTEQAMLNSLTRSGAIGLLGNASQQ